MVRGTYPSVLQRLCQSWVEILHISKCYLSSLRVRKAFIYVFIIYSVIISDGEIGLFGLLEIVANVVLRAG